MPASRHNRSPLEPDDDVDAIPDEEGDDKDDPAADPPVDLENEKVPESKATPIDRSKLVALLSDPRLRRRLYLYLVSKKKLSDDRAEEITQIVFTRALTARSWPENPAKMFAWLRAISRTAFVDDVRSRGRRRRMEEPRENVDLAVEPRSDIHAADKLKLLQKIVEENPAHAESLKMWAARADNEPVASIAAAMSMKEAAAYKRMDRFAALLRDRWSELTSAAAVGFAIFFLLLHFSQDDKFPVANPRTGFGPGEPLPALPSPTTADSIRRSALLECKHARYERCIELLDRARKLDPEGDKATEIVTARGEAERELRQKHVTP